MYRYIFLSNTLTVMYFAFDFSAIFEDPGKIIYAESLSLDDESKYIFH